MPRGKPLKAGKFFSQQKYLAALRTRMTGKSALQIAQRLKKLEWLAARGMEDAINLDSAVKDIKNGRHRRLTRPDYNNFGEALQARSVGNQRIKEEINELKKILAEKRKLK